MLLRLRCLLPGRARRASRRQLLPWAALFALPLVGLLLGLITPASSTEFELGQRDTSAPRLLAGEYSDTSSTLWLLRADDLNGRRWRLADVPHAPGWDIEAAAAPDEPVAAVLSLPPGGWDPKRQAVLDLFSERRAWRLATGLDLSGGVLWSDSGDHLLVRRDGGLLVLDTEHGDEVAHWSPTGVSSLYAVAMRGDRVWATTIDAWGTSLVELTLANGGISVRGRTRIADGTTRDWTLSPDGTLLAFSDQRGLELSVRVTALTESRADAPLLLSSASGAAARMAVADVSEGGGIPDSASPVWRSDGGLHFGVWKDAADTAGFTLPLGWDRSGDWLAVRWFSGSGPGDPGLERAAVRDTDGNLTSATDEHVRLYGWWHE